MGTRGLTVSELEGSLKRATVALRDADVAFIVGGSVASWARGGPVTEHDLDLMLKRDDAEAALAALEEAGMLPERPAEEWLYKAWDGEVGIDLIFEPKGLPVTEEVIERAEELHVFGLSVRVMAVEDVLTSKLLALSEHDLDLEGPLQIARSLRERIDWDAVRDRTDESPYARGFFGLLEELEVLETRRRTPPGAANVRVLGTPDTHADQGGGAQLG